MSYIIEETIQKLFENLETAYLEKGSFPDDLMLALDSIFGSIFLSALDLVDKNSVTHYTTETGKELFQIVGSTGKTYCCTSALNYCPCPSFAFGVIKRGDLIMCKHILAVHLCKALHSCLEKEVDEKQFTSIMYDY